MKGFNYPAKRKAPGALIKISLNCINIFDINVESNDSVCKAVCGVMCRLIVVPKSQEVQTVYNMVLSE